MLCFIDADEAREFSEGEAGTEAPSALGQPSAPTLGQAAVAVGKAQEALDRLLENPNGAPPVLKSVKRPPVRALCAITIFFT